MSEHDKENLSTIENLSDGGWIYLLENGIVFKKGEDYHHYNNDETKGTALSLIFKMQKSSFEETFGKLEYKSIAKDELFNLVEESYKVKENL